VMLQFRIPRLYGPRLKVAASAAGISGAAWLRQAVINRLDEENLPSVRAWVLPQSAASLPAAVLDIQTKPPMLFLSAVDKISARERTFLALQKDTGGLRRWSVRGLRGHKVDWFTDLEGHRFVLAGGSVWSPIVAIETDRGVEVTMQLEKA